MIGALGQQFEDMDPVWLLNQYRTAEVQGAGAIMRMGRLADDQSLVSDLSRHLRDEAVHAWLWTRALRDIGGEIIDVDQPYQSKLAAHFGLPRTLTDMLALTWVSESRGVEQYESHLDAREISPLIRRTLRAILKDEQWHVSYVHAELVRRSREDGGVHAIMDRAQDADATAMAELATQDSATPAPLASRGES